MKDVLLAKKTNLLELATTTRGPVNDKSGVIFKTHLCYCEFTFNNRLISFIIQRCHYKVYFKLDVLMVYNVYSNLCSSSVCVFLFNLSSSKQ